MRDLTMAAAGQAFGLGPVCDRYNRLAVNHIITGGRGDRRVYKEYSLLL